MKKNKKGIHNSPSTEFKKGQTGSKAGHWKGGHIIDKHGYISIYSPEHPFCTSTKYVKEHRLVIEKYLKRFLSPVEKVHHRNGNKSDNRLKNLILFSNESLHQKHEYREKFKKIKKSGNKQCTKCHRIIPLKDFNKHSQVLIGLRPECKTCQRLQQNISYQSRKNNHN